MENFLWEKLKNRLSGENQEEKEENKKNEKQQESNNHEPFDVFDEEFSSSSDEGDGEGPLSPGASENFFGGEENPAAGDQLKRPSNPIFSSVLYEFSNRSRTFRRRFYQISGNFLQRKRKNGEFSSEDQIDLKASEAFVIDIPEFVDEALKDRQRQRAFDFCENLPESADIIRRLKCPERREEIEEAWERKTPEFPQPDLTSPLETITPPPAVACASALSAQSSKSSWHLATKSRQISPGEAPPPFWSARGTEKTKKIEAPKSAAQATRISVARTIVPRSLAAAVAAESTGKSIIVEPPRNSPAPPPRSLFQFSLTNSSTSRRFAAPSHRLYRLWLSALLPFAIAVYQAENAIFNDLGKEIGESTGRLTENMKIGENSYEETSLADLEQESRRFRSSFRLRLADFCAREHFFYVASINSLPADMKNFNDPISPNSAFLTPQRSTTVGNIFKSPASPENQDIQESQEETEELETAETETLQTPARREIQNPPTSQAFDHNEKENEISSSLLPDFSTPSTLRKTPATAPPSRSSKWSRKTIFDEQE